jgi:uncharacterized protein
MLAERIGSSQLAEMCAQGASVTTTVRPDSLPRLARMVAEGHAPPDGVLDARIRFSNGPESFPVLQLRVTGAMDLTCQRCMAPVSCPLDLDVALTIVGSDAEADELADPFDSVVLDQHGGLRLRVAVEDEILAALPLVPLHGDGVGCGSVRGQSPTADTQPPLVSRPFAGLAALMREQGGDDRGT